MFISSKISFNKKYFFQFLPSIKYLLTNSNSPVMKYLLGKYGDVLVQVQLSKQERDQSRNKFLPYIEHKNITYKFIKSNFFLRPINDLTKIKLV